MVARTALALVAALWIRGGAQEIAEVGRGGTSKNAYFLMIGPMDAARSYRPWLFSAVAVAHTLKRFGSTADVVVLLAHHRDGVARPGDGVSLTATEEAALVGARCRWRYARPPGARPSGGFHMGNYKLLAWQHVEYDAVQVLDADLFPLGAMDPLFRLPRTPAGGPVACPGKVSPLNAGWVLVTPDLARFDALVARLDARVARLDRDAPWGHPMPGWVDAAGQAKPKGWKFFDAFGNQGHLYSYWRFDAGDLALVFHTARRGVEVLRYGDGGRAAGTPAPPTDAAAPILKAAFPCPFPAPERNAKTYAPAYRHFTGPHKPWSAFKPRNDNFAGWYWAVSRNGTDAAPLRALFPNVDDALALLRQTRGLR